MSIEWRVNRPRQRKVSQKKLAKLINFLSVVVQIPVIKKYKLVGVSSEITDLAFESL